MQADAMTLWDTILLILAAGLIGAGIVIVLAGIRPTSPSTSPSAPASLFIAAINRLWIHYFVAASPRAKCPCCGTRAKHKILHQSDFLWPDNSARGALLHVCGRCNAAWAERPLVNGEHWQITGEITSMQSPDASPSGDDSWVAVSREPKVQTPSHMRRAAQ